MPTMQHRAAPRGRARRAVRRARTPRLPRPDRRGRARRDAGTGRTSTPASSGPAVRSSDRFALDACHSGAALHSPRRARSDSATPPTSVPRRQRVRPAVARRPRRTARGWRHRRARSRSTGHDSNLGPAASTTTGPSVTSRCWQAPTRSTCGSGPRSTTARIPRWFDNDGGFDDDETFTTWWPRWVERIADRFGDSVGRVGAVRRDPASARPTQPVARHAGAFSRAPAPWLRCGGGGRRPRSRSTSGPRVAARDRARDRRGSTDDQPIGDRQLETASTSWGHAVRDGVPTTSTGRS